MHSELPFGMLNLLCGTGEWGAVVTRKETDQAAEQEEKRKEE
jgi:hypothetical protein